MHTVSCIHLYTVCKESWHVNRGCKIESVPSGSIWGSTSKSTVTSLTFCGAGVSSVHSRIERIDPEAWLLCKSHVDKSTTVTIMTGKDNEMYPGVAYCSIPSGFTTPSSAHVHVHYCNQALVAKARWALETLKEHQMVLIQLSWYMHHTNSPTSYNFCINHYRNYKSIVCVHHRCRCHRSSRQCIDQYRYQSQSQCLCRYQSFDKIAAWSACVVAKYSNAMKYKAKLREEFWKNLPALVELAPNWSLLSTLQIEANLHEYFNQNWNWTVRIRRWLRKFWSRAVIRQIPQSLLYTSRQDMAGHVLDTELLPEIVGS